MAGDFCGVAGTLAASKGWGCVRACGGRWAGPELLLGWSAGTGVALLCKNKKEEGPAGASPMAAPMPKSVSF